MQGPNGYMNGPQPPMGMQQNQQAMMGAPMQANPMETGPSYGQQPQMPMMQPGMQQPMPAQPQMGQAAGYGSVQPQTTMGGHAYHPQQPNMVAVVGRKGRYETEEYCGPISLIVGILLGPCGLWLFLCPMDTREVYRY